MEEEVIENREEQEEEPPTEKKPQDAEDEDWESHLEKHLDKNLDKQSTMSKGEKEYLSPRKVNPPEGGVRVIAEEETNVHGLKVQKKLEIVRKRKERLKMKIILIYTGLHKKVYWTNLPKNGTKGFLSRTGCPETKCHITYDKNLMPIADAVIFHERDMPSLGLVRSLSRLAKRPLSQRWVYFTSETPKNSVVSSIPYNGFFNWTMTYKVKSDIFLPYGQYRKMAENERPPPVVNYAKTKNATIAWLVGNCNFLFRMKFVKLLSRATKVSVGGSCRDGFPDKLPCTRWCDSSTLKNYKFYLAFENGICTDYITEKYWRYLEMGLVPVVLGGADYGDPRLAIPNSYIDASKFKSVKELANYLDYLDKNDTAYNEYFAWKQTYKLLSFGGWPFESYSMCNICKKLFAKESRKVYYKLSDFWSIDHDCEEPEDKLTKRFIPKDFDKGEIDPEKAARLKNSKENIPKDFDEEF